MLRAAALCAAISAAPAAAYLRTSWRHLAADPSYSFADYVAEYGKNYGPAEYKVHEAVFARALAEIRAHNAGPAAWKMGLNKYTDWSKEEMQRVKGLHRGARFAAPAPALRTTPVDIGDLPASKDWRDAGVMSAVKDQGGCGSCWAFASTETIESAVAIATGKSFVLSPQELVSCAPNPDECGGTGGCQGSTEPLAFSYATKVGMTTEAAYPYQMETGECNDTLVAAPVVGIKNFTRLPTNDYASLMHAVATVGPVAISVDASWGGYESGVYTGSCGSTIDHAVQLVGYGTAGGAYAEHEQDGDDNCTFPATPEDGYIPTCPGGGTTSCPNYATLEEAEAACVALLECTGVTLTSAGSYDLRGGQSVTPSPSGEKSWLISNNGKGGCHAGLTPAPPPPPIDYWLVRNSWGSSFGEGGYIRLKRFGDGKEPCATDTSPLDGNGCKGGPATMEVCGLCGLLSDSSYVTGAFVH